MRLTTALLLLALSSPALAQDVQNFKPAVGTWNYFGVEGGRVAPHLGFVPSLYLHYASEPLVLRDEEDKVIESIVGDLMTADVMAAFGIGDRFEIGVALPVNWVAGDQLSANNEEGFALGDLRLVPKLRLLGANEGETFGLSVSLPVTLPTGNPDRFVGANQVELAPKVILESRRGIVHLAANLGFRWRPEEQHVGTIDLGNEITYGAGAGIEIGTPDLLALGELYGAGPVSNISDVSRSAPLESVFGMRYFTKADIVVTGGLGLGIISDYGTPNLRALVGLAWSPQKRDADGDGLLDDEDECPTQPEDKDAWQDADGCPDPDNDGDTILDVHDKCPNAPETMNGKEDADGCPDEIGDTDGDGLEDDADRCVEVPEDYDGFEDDDGCPDLDNDKDGIQDVDDKCINTPETVNGHEDMDGCPDVSPLTKVRVTEGRIEILEKVFFATNKAVIKRRSYDVLEQVAAVLKANPQVKKVEIGGHTDSIGAAGYNRALSQRRAASVRAFLMERGIPAERLTAKGYGEDDPLESNGTPSGRSVNRRVEFKIIEGSGVKAE